MSRAVQLFTSLLFPYSLGLQAQVVAQAHLSETLYSELLKSLLVRRGVLIGVRATVDVVHSDGIAVSGCSCT